MFWIWRHVERQKILFLAPSYFAYFECGFIGDCSFVVDNFRFSQLTVNNQKHLKERGVKMKMADCWKQNDATWYVVRTISLSTHTTGFEYTEAMKTDDCWQQNDNTWNDVQATRPSTLTTGFEYTEATSSIQDCWLLTTGSDVQAMTKPRGRRLINHASAHSKT